jgi:hypothetical protein
MGRTLCIPSLELPNLTRLHADDGIGLIALLDAFDSPSVSILGIRITRPDTLHVAGLKSALRRISLRTQPTKLELKLSLMCADHIPLDDEERTIVSALYCVDCVRLVTDRVGEARSILPWLKMLPALRRLELSHLVLRNNSPSSDRNDPELVAFMEDARTALPWVSEVHLAYGGNTVS